MLSAPDADALRDVQPFGRNLLRRFIVGGIAALGLLGSAPVVAPAALPVAHQSIVSKTCSGSFTHAVINGSEKCLRRGQFCARAADRTYRQYGFRCTKRDASGRYHLS
jgi:hypothetical protein